MVLWCVYWFEFLSWWREKVLAPQKEVLLLAKYNIKVSMSFFTKHSKPVLNFRLLLPKVKLVNFYFKSTHSFPFVIFGGSHPIFWLLHPQESQLEKTLSLFWGTFLSLRTHLSPCSPLVCTAPTDTPADPACLCDICSLWCHSSCAPHNQIYPPPLPYIPSSSPKPGAGVSLQSSHLSCHKVCAPDFPQTLRISHISEEHHQRLPYIFF